VETTSRTKQPSNPIEGKLEQVDKVKWKIYDTQQECGIIPSVAVFICIGGIGTFFWISLYTLVLAKGTERKILSSLLLLLGILPREFPKKIGLKLFEYVLPQTKKYFGLKTTIEDEEALVKISDARNCVVIPVEPHDVLPFTLMFFAPPISHLPGHVCSSCRMLVTSALTYLPFMRQEVSWGYCDSVDKQKFYSKLARNETIAFTPGGVQEVAMMDPSKPDEIVLCLKNRKGFVKIALSNGTPIVPTFSFNLDGCYGYWVPKGEIMLKIGRVIGFMPMIFWGRFGIPFGIPYPQKIHLVIGKPIQLPKEPSASDESIEKYHSIYLKELEKLFDRHKVEAGYGHRILKIV